jgi:hypothetical protein
LELKSEQSKEAASFTRGLFDLDQAVAPDVTRLSRHRGILADERRWTYLDVPPI